jgi:hypothetical protein
MKIINMKRHSGKTTMLIHTAYVTESPIIVYDKRRAESVYQQAVNMGFDKIDVFTIDEWVKQKPHTDSVLIDEGKEIIEAALISMLHTRVSAITLSEPMITKDNEKGEQDK